MKSIIISSVLLLIVACDNTKSEHAIYGNWVRVKTIETEMLNGIDTISEEEYYPESDDYLTAEIIEIKENEMNAYTDDVNGTYTVDFVTFSPKTLLDYELKDKKLSIFTQVSVNNNLIIVYENIYMKYNGKLPPQSWLD